MTTVPVKTWRERIGADATFPLHVPTDVERAMEAEIAELRAQAGQPTADMLDMLGRIHPLAMPDKAEKDRWFQRLRRTCAIQQPLPVPDQAAAVWRWDLLRATSELIQLRALRDFNREQRAREDVTQQPSDQASNGEAAQPEPRVWQQCEGASLTFNIKGLEEVAPGIRAVVTREPTVGKWYAGVNNSQPLPVYGATARYEGEGRWYLGTGNRIDLYQYDYLQELV